MLGVNELKEIAIKCGTPSYIFDTDVLCERIDKMQEILGCGVTVCYAMKANPFLIGTLDKKLDRFEVCSPGEFAICEKEGIDRSKIVLSGVNKEKGRTTLADELGTVPATLPALMRAQKLQKRAGRCGVAQPDKTRAQQALQDALDGWSREQDARTAGELLFQQMACTKFLSLLKQLLMKS